MSGQTDLDVLVHKDDQAVFESEMAESGFKQILSPPEKCFPGFEDYLGFDDDTGEFTHLHVHYGLIMGRKYVKNHYLPIEALYFDNLTEKLGVKIPCPELELVMLIMRAHLKTDYESIIKHAIKDTLRQPYTAFPRDIENEFDELSAAIDHDKFCRLLEETGLPVDLEWCNTFLQRISSRKLRWHHILSGHYRIRRELRPYRRNKSVTAQLNYFRHFLLNSSIGGLIFKGRKKTLPQGGRIFSFVGADGSGKSTLIRDITKWLSWKLATSEYYYGIPKDSVRSIAEFLMRVFGKLKLRGLLNLTERLFWLHVGKSRQTVSQRTIKDVSRGQVVVTDRFPLQDFQNMDHPMDNPRIDPMATLFGRNLREIEERYYANLRAPDRVVVLQVELEELRRRKTDISREMHVKKADAVNALQAREGLVTIDANQPYEDVLLAVKRSIWSAL